MFGDSYICFVWLLTQKCDTHLLPVLNGLEYGAPVSLKFHRKYCANI